MPTPKANQFATVRTEGAILPPDLLQLVAEESRELEGLTPAAYHLIPGEKLNEAATRSFNRLLAAWANFKIHLEKLPPDDPATSATREKWLLMIFSELGYGRLAAAPAVTIEDKTYAISHVWQKTPLHLVGYRVDLDSRAAGMKGASQASPHSLMQEFLNRSPGHLWGFVSNGQKLRVLRDTRSLARQAFVEFDLQQMFEGQNYPDFKLLWLVCHQSRVEGDRPEQCVLEKWSQTAIQRGTRLHEKLRAGVADAIEAMGRGYLAHPSNTSLRDKLRHGKLDKQDYYRQLLRQVYRLLFLFVAEDRELLLLPGDTQAPAREIYQRYYSTRRLRQLAGSLRGSPHPDLYRALRLVFSKLNATGCQELALPALGSLLWSEAATPDLDVADLANRDLLDAVFKLAFTQDDTTKSLRPVDYRNLGSEEFGSVYEGLLELHPNINADAATFALATAAGNERKTTGSYYTPTSLVNCLLDSALEPVLAEAIQGGKGYEGRGQTPEQRILSLKVCDPACGSGHFLIAAAYRIAKRLAAVRSGDEEPAPEHYRHALRDVIGHCIYGVDLNPMAVELCKVSLWMEAMEPGKPLSFLDHRIQVGNSLLGTTPALLAKGIPDEAFEPIEGDDKALCRAYKKQNKQERKGQIGLFEDCRPWEMLGNLAAGIVQLDAFDADSIEGQRQKQHMWETMVRSGPYETGRLLADAWCAAFVWKKTKELDYAITEAIFRRIEKHPHDIAPWMKEEIRRLARQYQFMHWHLAFPDVFGLANNVTLDTTSVTGWTGGFDVVLGNPPWERPKPEPAKFFAASRPDIAEAQTSAVRDKLLRELEGENSPLIAAWREHQRSVMATVGFLTQSGQYLLTARGKFNLGNTFLERARVILHSAGRAGLLNVSGLATDESGTEFVADLMHKGALVSFYDFENREGLFPAVHSSYKFSAITICGSATQVPASDFVFFAHDTADLIDGNRHVSFSAEDIRLLNPVSLNCPVFRDRRQAELVKVIYRRADLVPTVNERVMFRWKVEPTFLFVMSDHSHLFSTRETLGLSEIGIDNIAPTHCGERYLPLYESKMFHQFEHRWSSVTSDGTQVDITAMDRRGPHIVAVPRYWMRATDAETKLNALSHNWLIAVREVTNATNERTVISAVLPRYPVGHNAQVFRFEPGAHAACVFLAIMNSFVFDFAARTKVGGSHLSSFILRQLPVLPESVAVTVPEWTNAGTLAAWTLHHVLELTYTSLDMQTFAADCGYSGPPFIWKEDRRVLIRCELDAAFFILYGISRDDVDYILSTFPIVERKDREKYGTYRTRDTILEIYDAMAEAMRTGQPYRTRLDPPPGPPTDAAGNFIPVEQWSQAAWPRHIHLPQTHSVLRPTIQQLEDGLAVMHVLCLLYAWENAPVDRRTLDLGIILLNRDDLRSRILKHQPVASTTKGTDLTANVGHIDEFLHELAGTQTLEVFERAGRQMVKLGANAPAKAELLADSLGRSVIAKANETVRAVAILAEQDQPLDLYVGANENVAIDLALR